MSVRAGFGYFRLALAATCLLSLIARFIWGLGSATFNAGNFFGYLTIHSNIWFLLCSILAGILALTDLRDPQWLTSLRAAVLTGTVTSGVVYGILVQQSAARGFPITVPWSDVLMHWALPAVALIDWIVAPGRGRAQWRAAVYAVGYVTVWGVVTLVRGAIVGWYPYYFLDPNQVSGIPELALWSALSLVVFGGVATGLVAITRRAAVFDRSREVRRLRTERARAALPR